LQRLKPVDVTVGTKVRLPPGDFGRIADAVTTSLEGNLARPPATLGHASVASSTI
jgi:hypothetical protein